MVDRLLEIWACVQDNPVIVSAILALIGGVGLYFKWWQTQIAKRQLEMDKNSEQRQRKANVVAEIDTSSRHLVIRNLGPAKAEQVTVSVDGGPIRESGIFFDEPSVLPQLADEEPHRFTYAYDNSAPDFITVQIEWNDPSGGDSWTKKLRLG